MKVKVVSDLHLECCEQGHGVPDLGSGEYLILGGDILCARNFKKNGKLNQVYKDFLQKCADNFAYVLYVAGNHEAYGYNYEGTWDVLRENFPSGVCLLENNTLETSEWIFIGATLWTDFCNGHPLEMLEAKQCMNDYKTIRITPKYRKMQPEDTYRFHNESRHYIEEKLKEYKDKKVWILTHHAPSWQSVHEKYRRSGISNGAYVSNLDNLILDNPQIKVWSHGHTHTTFDYKIGGCRVVCNPRGYYNGYNNADLNIHFDPNFVIDTDTL